MLWISDAKEGLKARIIIDPLTLGLIEEALGRDRAEEWADRIAAIMRKASEEVAREVALLDMDEDEFEIRTEEAK